MPFKDPEWIHDENFKSDEWETLKKVCSEMYPDEELAFEMMYTLIDLENKASDVNQRKGILDDINSVWEKTFYKNEEDATKFYSDIMTRKKESGGKYNEKFLDYQPLVTEFENDEEE
jgi:DNA sulfur modification protein DndC